MSAITDLLLKILQVLGLIASEVENKVKELQAKYPEGDAAWEAFLTWWFANMTANLQHDTAVALAREAWIEITSERPGYNPKHGGIA